MDRDELVQYWTETADRDYVTMEHLYESGDYNWCLFLGHLVIEKLLKACYVKRVGARAPRMHNLVRLAELCDIETDAPRKEILARLALFHIHARYPDFKREFYRIATRKYTAKQVLTIKETREWLLKMLSE